MTSTAKITFRWFDRNNLGEPLPITRHGCTELSFDESDGKLLANASEGLQTLGMPYPHATLLTETALTPKDWLRMAGIFVLAGFTFWGFCDFCQWLGGKL